jgi:hypothetical protein
MAHPPVGSARTSSQDPGPLCRSCPVHWVFTGQARHRPRPRPLDGALLVGLLVTAAAALGTHRDVGAVLAALICAAAAVMVLRDRTRRCQDCAALRVAPASDVPAAAAPPAGTIPLQRQRRP